jgi:putative protease
MNPAGAGPRSSRRLPELLAPAGSPEALRAAVAAGADAVYLSGKKFGARKFAANFSDSGMEEAIRYAHSRGVRVHVTVNTLVHDRELREAAEYLVRLYAAGADAVLVQDAGIAALARETVPGLTLHASTQMTVHNTAGVLWAAGQGFSRVVLARELSLAEIRTIAEKTRHTGIGLEVFAHGALCYSFSGQCLLSSVIGGRSGNRGMCAQPCRKPYSLVTGPVDTYGRPEKIREVKTPGRYLLSPKDLSTYRHLPELADAPVVSLKIEGRMKSPEYVAVVVSAYRKALDAIAAGDWQPDPGTERDLLLAFNRGFTKGYLFGDRHGSLMSRDAPDNRGICIGTVAGYDRKSGVAAIRPEGTLVPEAGDGLFFAGPAGTEGTEEWGFQLNTTPAATGRKTMTIAIPRPVAPGMRVFVTSSRGLEARARQIIARTTPDDGRKIPVDLRIGVDAEGHVSMKGSVALLPDKRVEVAYDPDLTLVPARSRPLTRDQFEAQVRKTGDTPFAIRDFVLGYNGTLFAPVGELNRMRREFLALAKDALQASFIPPEREIARAREHVAAAFGEPGRSRGDRGTGHPAGLTLYADSPEAVSAAAGAGCTAICFEPAVALPRHTCGTGTAGKPSFHDQAAEAMAVCRHAGIRFVLKLPRITRDDYLAAVLPEIARLHNEGLAECLGENPGTELAIRALMPGMIVSGGGGLNVFNHRAACNLCPPFRSLTLSPELSGDECRVLIAAARGQGCTAPFALVVQGIGEAMITEDCLREPVQHCRPETTGGSAGDFLGLRDGTGHIFPFRTDGACRTAIGNAVETCLVDRLPAILEAGIGEVVIDARGRTGAYAGAMARMYREALDRAGKGELQKEEATAFREQAKALSYGGITAGHFLRGLKE